MLAAFRRRVASSSSSSSLLPLSWQAQQQRSASSAAAAAAAADAPAANANARPWAKHSPADFPPARIRNFSIIAHVDHGKSTLADALMKRLGAIAPDARAQFLDRLEVERTRGITVKSASASLIVGVGGGGAGSSSLGGSQGDGEGGGGSSSGGGGGGPYLLNLIDTPGHVDFSYEVSRSLAACQGALLLVDAARGVQAQTVATYLAAAEQFGAGGIIPVLTKIDLPGASDRARARRELCDTFGFRDDEVLEVSAKAGVGLAGVVRAVVERVPPPPGTEGAPLRLRLVDAWHDAFRGVVSLVAVVDGVLRRGDRLASCAALAAAAAAGGSGAPGALAAGAPASSSASSATATAAALSLEALEVGVLAPEPHPTGELRAGQVGYVVTGLRDLKAARVGDTWVRRPDRAGPDAGGGGKNAAAAPASSPSSSSTVAGALKLALPGFRPAKPVVFAGLFPASADAYGQLSAAVERLTLNDASVSVKKDHSDALGAGFRAGFLGPLHLDVFLQRLEQEHGAEVVASAPSVPVEVDVLVAAAGGRRGAGDGASSSPAAASPSRRRTIVVEAPSDWPRGCRVLEVREPTVVATIVAPSEHCGAVMALATARRGEQVGHAFLGGSGGGRGGGGDGPGDGGAPSASSAAAAGHPSVGGRVVLRYVLPLAELARGFYGALKQATSGYASLDYEAGAGADGASSMRPADLQLLEVLVNGAPLDPLARLVHSSEAERAGRALVTRLAALLEREQFEVALQASVGGRVVARETVKARRRDVLAKCYGGDATRKRKLLEKQKEGKKQMRRFGSVRVSAELFPQLLKPV